MRRLLLLFVLLGMVLIHAPKALLHDCIKEMQCHNFSCCDHEQDENDLSVDMADCELCTYTFHSVDTPNLPLRFLSVNTSYALLAMKSLSVSIGTIQYPKLRGPPAIVMIEMKN